MIVDSTVNLSSSPVSRRIEGVVELELADLYPDTLFTYLPDLFPPLLAVCYVHRK
jgi:hypothetical protein